MNEHHRVGSEKLLRELYLGTQIVGTRWYSNVEVIFDRAGARAPDKRFAYAQLYLRIEARCAIFRTRPALFPESVDDLPVVSLTDTVGSLATLAGQEVVDVALGVEYAHLIVTFDSGAILFVHGYDEQYESWNLEAEGLPSGQIWLIGAMPGGRVAYAVPEAKDRVHQDSRT